MNEKKTLLNNHKEMKEEMTYSKKIFKVSQQRHGFILR